MWGQKKDMEFKKIYILYIYIKKIYIYKKSMPENGILNSV